MALPAEVLAAAALMATPARRQLLVEAQPEGLMPAPTATMTVVDNGIKRISPLKKLSTSVKSKGTKTFRVTSTFSSTSSDSNSAGC
jgi:hypothetical protein